MGGPVVAGVDGSQPNLVAVDVAARETYRRSMELQVIHAVEWPGQLVTAGVSPWDSAGARGGRNGALTEARRRARVAAPDVELRCEVTGPAGAMASRTGRVIVHAARCPVAVVRTGGGPTR